MGRKRIPFEQRRQVLCASISPAVRDALSAAVGNGEMSRAIEHAIVIYLQRKKDGTLDLGRNDRVSVLRTDMRTTLDVND